VAVHGVVVKRGRGRSLELAIFGETWRELGLELGRGSVNRSSAEEDGESRVDSGLAY
jgi:hypothetical protein